MFRHIHVIAFDIPDPPVYGGAIDVFYRIKSLSELGVQISLHCFYKGDLRPSDELAKLCKEVYYYPRKTSIVQHAHFLPYGVISRTHEELLPRLLNDKDPILFEGLVSCALMRHPALRQRKKYFRECNVEHDYYHALGRASHSIWKKIFFHLEACRLKYFEKTLRYANGIFALAHQDEAYFKTHYPEVQTTYAPCFHPFTKTSIPSGLGKYILYHGNLAVAENHNAAMYILRQIASVISYPIIIAGAKPNGLLRKTAAQYKHVTLIDTPERQTMQQLIRDAQLHLLITFQPTGIKLKLLSVLYTGRQVLVNPEMVVGTELAPLCNIASSSQEMITLIHSLIKEPVTEENIHKRETILNQGYNNTKSAQIIIRTIYQSL